MSNIKETVRDFICSYALEKDKSGLIANIWQQPLVAFGDANHQDFSKLRQVAHREHIMPWEVLPQAKTIVAYFFPFNKEIGNSNRRERLSSKEWAMAYEKTNAALGDLAKDLVDFLKAQGYKAAFTQEAFQYDTAILQSRWSQRHVAYLSGLGTFGLNNMLITKKGTCGRIGTVVTDLDVETDKVIAKEYCTFKAKGACRACIKRCPAGALTTQGYDPRLCDTLCTENAKVHVGYGSSYTLSDSGEAVDGTNTCGKCMVGVPCTFGIPK